MAAQAYADSSFLVSLYHPDANHAAAVVVARGWKQPPLLPLTPFGAFELNNTLRRLVFLGHLTPTDLRKLAARIMSDVAVGVFAERPLEGYRLIAEAEAVSRLITARHGVRALDVLHIAAARMHGAKEFLSFDQNQRRAATAAGLRIKP